MNTFIQKSGNKRYNFVYKTVNLKNGIFYIGVHSTNNLNDNYLGSGFLLLKSIKKHGKRLFRRDILCFTSSREEAYRLEKALVTRDLIKSRKCFNRAEGGQGGFIGEEAIEKMRLSKMGGVPWNKGTGRINKCVCGKLLENKRAKRCRRCYKGVHAGKNNPAAKYLYKTPKGTFDSSREASMENGVPVTTLRRWAKLGKNSFSLLDLDK